MLHRNRRDKVLWKGQCHINSYRIFKSILIYPSEIDGTLWDDDRLRHEISFESFNVQSRRLDWDSVKDEVERKRTTMDHNVLEVCAEVSHSSSNFTLSMSVKM